MELKKSFTEEDKEDIAAIIDNEGFGYAVLEGFIKPEEVLESKVDASRVKKAIETLRDFRDTLPQL